MTNLKVDMLSKFTDQLAEEFEIVDLTHTLEENIPCWPTHARFGHTLYESYEFGDLACHYQLTMSEHTGTHMDAPNHFIAEGTAHYGIDSVKLSQVFGRAAVIDASLLPANGLLSRSMVEEWEKKNGDLRTGDIVLIRFGWDCFWGVRPNDANFLKDWPGVGGDAAEYFVEKGIKLVGVDTLAIDSYDTTDNPAHYTLLSNEVLIIENLNRLDQLPAFCLFFALPLPIKGGSGSPVRAMAYVPKR